jgi:hypothetical protein
MEQQDTVKSVPKTCRKIVDRGLEQTIQEF